MYQVLTSYACDFNQRQPRAAILTKYTVLTLKNKKITDMISYLNISVNNQGFKSKFDAKNCAKFSKR